MFFLQPIKDFFNYLVQNQEFSVPVIICLIGFSVYFTRKVRQRNHFKKEEELKIKKLKKFKPEEVLKNLKESHLAPEEVIRDYARKLDLKCQVSKLKKTYKSSPVDNIYHVILEETEEFEFEHHTVDGWHKFLNLNQNLN